LKKRRSIIYTNGQNLYNFSKFLLQNSSSLDCGNNNATYQILPTVFLENNI